MKPTLLDLNRLSAELQRFPEFRKPLPVDREVIGDTLWPGGPYIGPLARGELATFNFHRGDFNLTGYSRSPWAVVKQQMRHALMRASIYRGVLGNASIDSTYANVAGTARTLRIAGATGAMWNDQGGSNDQSKLKYGSSGAAATEDDNDLATAVGATIDASAVSYDNALKRTTTSGSRVHGEAATTGREIGCFQNRSVAAIGVELFMMDRSIVADQAIAVGNTVAVSYTWQF